MNGINNADNAFVLISAALVMFMTPGLALFYGGMVRSKNVLATIMQSFIAIALVSIIWAILGYSLAFGPDRYHLIGSLQWVGLKGVSQSPNPDYAATIPHLVFMIYQAMFAIITPAIITGAFAERVKFRSFLLFTALWSILVYSPIAHWVWGVNGWIRNMGALDFAGGTVVHISSGIAAMAFILVAGKRKGFGVEALYPHNISMTIIGAAILWFGWFGFNAGSALTSGVLASSAFVATHLAAAAALLGWITIEWIIDDHPTTLGAASGCVAGLVAITPAAGFVGPMSAILIGLAAGMICYLAVKVKWKLKYDDSLDVVGIHGVGGTLGAIATGLLAQKAVNATGENGLFFGNPALLGKQLIAVLAVMIYSLVVTFIIVKVIDALIGIRVSEEAEESGLDLSEHSETGYSF